jgi:hypothetical protein
MKQLKTIGIGLLVIIGVCLGLLIIGTLFEMFPMVCWSITILWAVGNVAYVIGKSFINQ